MATIREWKSAALRDLQATGFSRRWLWELLRRLDLKVGSRVLVAGRRSLGLLRFLNKLGIESTGLDDSTPKYQRCDDAPPNVIQARPELIVPVEPHSVDAVIVSGLRVFERPLNESASLAAAANLLAAIRPGGHLVAVSAAETSLDASRDHTADCYENLLRRFGSQIELFHGRNLLRWASFLWSPNATPPTDWQVSFTLPAMALDRTGWLCRAESTTADNGEPCCGAWSGNLIRNVA